jgi:hypothetical protein
MEDRQVIPKQPLGSLRKGNVMGNKEYPPQLAIILILITLMTCAAVIRHPTWFGETAVPAPSQP